MAKPLLRTCRRAWMRGSMARAVEEADSTDLGDGRFANATRVGSRVSLVSKRTDRERTVLRVVQHRDADASHVRAVGGPGKEQDVARAEALIDRAEDLQHVLVELPPLGLVRRGARRAFGLVEEIHRDRAVQDAGWSYGSKTNSWPTSPCPIAPSRVGSGR